MDDTIYRGYYAVIPADVRYDTRLTSGAKLLFAEITALSNDKGFCWAGNKYFASLYSVSERNITRWINELVDCGYVFRDIEYYPNTKEIRSRVLQIVNQNGNQMSVGVDKNVSRGGDKNVRYPTDKNVRENNININTINNNINNKGGTDISNTDIEKCIRLWNELSAYGIPSVVKMSSSCQRTQMLKCRLNEYGMESFEKAIENIKHSKFLQGKSSSFLIKFDWFVRPNNFIKVLEGNYNDSNNGSSGASNKYTDMIFE